MAIDALGVKVKVGDIICYGSARSHSKAQFRVAIVIDAEKPTVIPFEKGYDWHDMSPRERKWVKMRPFGFTEVKKGDFAIITNEIKDEQLREAIYQVQIEYKMRMI